MPDGDWIAADRLMGEIRSKLRNEPCRNGHNGPCDADHIGPISLGFSHHPEFQMLCSSCNSAKNNRMNLSDVQRLRQMESTGASVVSWHSKALWDLRKQSVADDETAFPFQIKVEGTPQIATLRFATQAELRRYHRSLTQFARGTSTVVREAVEFTRLAAKRWRYYSRSDEAAESFADLQRAIRRDPKCEFVHGFLHR